jgi:hypothetical protein
VIDAKRLRLGQLGNGMDVREWVLRANDTSFVLPCEGEEDISVLCEFRMSGARGDEMSRASLDGFSKKNCSCLVMAALP